MSFILNLWKNLAMLLTIIFFIVFLYFKWKFGHWKRRNITCIEPRFPFGHCLNPFTSKQGFGVRSKLFYNEYKSRGLKYAGIFQFLRPVYFPVDRKIIKNILSKDFNYFSDRGIYSNEKDDPISVNLTTLDGLKWKNLRTNLTPAFTPGKIKMMLETIVECGKQLEEELFKCVSSKKKINIKEVASCFTIDIIGSCAFGLSCNSFENPNSLFAEHSRKFFKQSKFDVVKMILTMSFPRLTSFLKLALVPDSVSFFFMGIVKETIQYRENNNVKRNDFLQILIDLKNNKTKKENVNCENLTLEQICGQSFLFFIAGYETSSSTMSFCLYELAVHQAIQKRVRDEINEILLKYNGIITYEAVLEMEFLEQVIDETLRKYPPLPYIGRKCTEDYKLPNEDIIIEKSTSVGISILGVHHDSEYFPEPEKFDPERFSVKNRKTIKPFTYIPFGEGPRICIGRRFGLMETKVGLIFALKNFNFTLSSNMEQPLVLTIDHFIMSAKNDIWLNAIAVN